jgi:methyl coenzyme M reductase gamma subunit
LAFFVALGSIRFEGESRPASHRYPGKEYREVHEPLGASLGNRESFMAAYGFEKFIEMNDGA